MKANSWCRQKEFYTFPVVSEVASSSEESVCQWPIVHCLMCQSRFKCVFASAEAEQKEEHRVWNRVSPVLDAVSLKKGVASEPLKNRHFVIDITKSKQFFRTQWV